MTKRDLVYFAVVGALVYKLFGACYDRAHKEVRRIERIGDSMVNLNPKPKPIKKKKIVTKDGIVTITPIDKSKSLDEVVVIKERLYGLCFKPALQFDYLANPGIDFKLAFYRNLGIVAGVGVYRGYFYPNILLSYRLQGVLPLIENIEIAGGFRNGSNNPVWLGFRLPL